MSTRPFSFQSCQSIRQGTLVVPLPFVRVAPHGSLIARLYTFRPSVYKLGPPALTDGSSPCGSIAARDGKREQGTWCALYQEKKERRYRRRTGTYIVFDRVWRRRKKELWWRDSTFWRYKIKGALLFSVRVEQYPGGNKAGRKSVRSTCSSQILSGRARTRSLRNGARKRKRAQRIHFIPVCSFLGLPVGHSS